MRRNTMLDLHDHLMARIEALGDVGDEEDVEEIDKEKLDLEIRRSEATSKVAATMIANLRLGLDMDRHLAEYDRAKAGSVLTPRLLAGDPAKEGNGSK